MDGSHTTRFFLEPEQAFHRQYEALRAIFVDTAPLDEVAARFGFKASTLRSMASRFRVTCGRGGTAPFFARTDGDDLPAQRTHTPTDL